MGPLTLQKKQAGFTLIELLVVISVISLLSSVVLSSISDVRASARDTKRVEQMTTIIPLIDQYYYDNGQPPGQNDTSGVHLSKKCSSDIKSDIENSNLFGRVPSDPGETACDDDSNSAQFYGWDSSRCGEDYCISINTLETQKAKEQLSERFGIPIQGGKVRDQKCGGNANIVNADFNYCFADQWGL